MRARLQSKSALFQRVVAGMGANAFAQGVTVLIQLASLPLFLSHWSVATYGVWLMLSAFVSYLSMADAGMVSAAGNRMTMAVGAGQTAEANAVFQSAVVFVSLICAVVSAIAFPLLLWAPIPGLTDTDRRMALLALAATMILSLFSGLADAHFRATGRYATGIWLSSSVRLGEWLASMVGLVVWGSFAAVAAGALLARLIGLAALVVLSRRGNSVISWGTRDASGALVRSLARPAAWFMVFPLANAVNFQGMTLLVGQFLGPAAVAMFNTYRTLARVTVQLTSVFSHALAPELSVLHGAGDVDRLRRVYRRSTRIGGAFGVLTSAAVYWPSPWMLDVWSRGAIEFNGPVVALLMAYAAISSLWHVPRMLLMAINQHGPLAFWYAATAVLALAMAGGGALAAGLVGVAVAIVAAELLIAFICYFLARSAVLADDAPREMMLYP